MNAPVSFLLVLVLAGLVIGYVAGYLRGRARGGDEEWLAQYFREVENDRARRDKLGRWRPKT